MLRRQDCLKINLVYTQVTLIKMVNEKVLDSKYLKMEIGTKVNGKMIKLMAKANFGMLMEIIMKVFGRMIKLMVWDYFELLMAPLILGNGKMIFSMDKDEKPGQIAHHFKVFMHRVKKMDEVYIITRMDRNMMENGKKIRLME